MSRYTLNAGRLIERDGAPVATLHGIRPYDPVTLDLFARSVVAALNAVLDTPALGDRPEIIRAMFAEFTATHPGSV